MLIVGVGIAPNTTYLKKNETGIVTDRTGAIVCDPFLQTSIPDIYAAGDMCTFPYWKTGKNVRIEHWIHAMDQGSYAAFNMLGKFIPYGNTPFFWTRHYNKSMQYVGHCMGPDEIIVKGDVAAQKFIAYYVKEGKIQAVSGMANSVAVLTMFEAFNQNKVPDVEEIRSGKVTPADLRKTLKITPGKGCTRQNCCSKAGTQ
jgi:NADPH-dependent 2,4-dienoyl-CoA reductase/sulfur reductase-like enzyme